MDFEGSGILALWNGADAERRQEYNLWHTREHVPERLGVPGMRSARRYVRTSGPLPEYLTLYEMTDLSVLSSAPYLSLLNNPTEWSRSMRPSFRGFLRVCCARVSTRGGGMGTCLATLVATEGTNFADPGLAALIQEVIEMPGAIPAVHIIKADKNVPSVPFQINGSAEPDDVAGAILLEGFDEADLADAIDRVLPALQKFGLGDQGRRPSFYNLAYAMTSASLGKIHPLSAFDIREDAVS